MVLSKSQIEEFYEVGYIKIENVFSEKEVSEMSNSIDRLEKISRNMKGNTVYKGSQFIVSEQKNKKQVRRVVWCGAAEPLLLNLGRDYRLTAVASQVMGCQKANHLINQIHFKLPHDGVFYPFHQDSYHRGYGTEKWKDVNGKGSYIQILTAIDPLTKENGPLVFIPGSCKKGHLNLIYNENRQTISEKFNPNEAVPALLNQGDIVTFGPYVIHGSEPNNSKKPRRVFINGFSYPGANRKIYPGEGAGELINLL